MSVQQKCGQMVQAEKQFTSGAETLGVTPQESGANCIGSLLLSGNTKPDGGNSPSNFLSMYNAYQQNVCTVSGQKIPILFGVDAVHGHQEANGAVVLPHNIGLAATRSTEVAYNMGLVTAEEMLATGVDFAFAPCVAVARDDRWGRTYESFGEDPEIATKLVGAWVNASQNAGGRGIAACVKHFVADGGTDGGKDQGNFALGDSVLRQIHLPPYKAAVEADVATVMASYSTVSGTKMHAHKQLITDVLKTEFGFKGFVISDYDAVNALPGGSFQDKVTSSVNAGVDMIMTNWNPRWKVTLDSLISAVNAKQISESRVNDAVKRILNVKKRFIPDWNNPTWNPPSSLSSAFGGSAHKAMARDAVRKSLVLLKNDGPILPLSRNAKIAVAGGAANDLGRQCGGWTVDWQGVTGNDRLRGTTILQGIQAVAPSASMLSGNGAGYDAIVVVVQDEKNPAAEGKGDSTSLAVNSADAQTFSSAAGSGVPIILIVISGRPVIITDMVPKAKAVIAAWFPGTEGGNGIADLLFSVDDADFSGTLPVTWPNAVSQEPINNGDNKSGLFKYGFGLNYGKAPKDPCASSPCKAGATCVATADKTAYKCNTAATDPCASSPCRNGEQCNSNTAQTQYSCTKPQPCASSPCARGETCVANATANSYTCKRGTANPCADSPCGDGQVCRVSGASFVCDVENPCEQSPCQGGGTCVQTGAAGRGFECQCPDGAEPLEDGVTCESDTVGDDCASAGCAHNCIVKSGRPQCVCRSSYELASDGKRCTKVTRDACDNSCKTTQYCDTDSESCKPLSGAATRSTGRVRASSTARNDPDDLPEDDDNKSPKSSGLDTVVIVAIAAGALVLLTVLLLCCLRRKQSNTLPTSPYNDSKVPYDTALMGQQAPEPQPFTPVPPPPRT